MGATPIGAGEILNSVNRIVAMDFGETLSVVICYNSRRRAAEMQPLKGVYVAVLLVSVQFICQVRADTNQGRELLQATDADQTAEPVEVECWLRDPQIERYLDPETRVWSIDDNVVADINSDLQILVDCTEPGDTLLFNVTDTIRPRRRITLAWNLTLNTIQSPQNSTTHAYPEAPAKTAFTCPREKEGVFYIRSPDVVLVNLIFKRCTLYSSKTPRAVIDIDSCNSENTTGVAQLRHVEFHQNRLRRSVALRVAARSCSALEMVNVQFTQNDCYDTCGAMLSHENDLKDILIEGNINSIHSDNPVMLHAPSESRTKIQNLTASSNQGVVLYVRGASLEIRGSSCLGNSRKDFYRDLPMRSVPFEAIPFSACIDLYNSTAEIVDCRFENNTGSYGQAMTAIQSNITLQNSILKSNVGHRGGAILIKEGHGRIRNSSFVGNTVDQDGGAIRGITAVLNISETVFRDNSAQYDGGALFLSQSPLISHSVGFINNSAQTGGCLYLIYPASFHISLGLFSRNRAETGGVMALFRNTTGVVEESNFSRNSAQITGSVAYAYFGSSLKMQDCQVDRNSGTALFARAQGEFRIHNCRFESNDAENKLGGGIECVFRSSFVMTHTTFFRNTALSGAAFSLEESSIGVVQNCQFDQNSAATLGGCGFVRVRSTLYLSNSIFKGNSGGRGAALYGTVSSVMQINDTQFLDGDAEHGGAIAVDQGMMLAVERSHFEGNVAREYGGAVDIGFSSCTIKDSDFIQNRVINYGGAVAAFFANMSITGGQIRENEARRHGGGILAIRVLDLLIEDVKFISNRAFFGGAVGLTGRTSAEVRDCLFWNSTAAGADESAGGAAYLLSSNLTLTHSELLQNSAVLGGDVFASDAYVTMVATSFRDSSAKKKGGSIAGVTGSDISIRDSSILGAQAGTSGGGINLYRAGLRARGLDVIGCRAALGGGLYAAASSTVLCSNCRFESNRAREQGGGVYLSSSDTQFLAFQFENSHIYDNTADIGAGLHVVSEDRVIDCADPFANCTFVALSGTDFRDNEAKIAGGAVLASDLNTIHVNCTALKRDDTPQFYKREGEFENMGVLNSFEGICPEWTGNHAGVYGDVIGSYAHRMKKWLHNGATNETIELDGVYHRVRDHQSGSIIPSVFLEMVDALGQGPVSGIGDVPVEAVMSSPEGLFTGSLNVILEGGAGNFSGVAGYVPPGDYDVYIDFSQKSLPRITLAIEIRPCRIGESVAANGTYCQPCSGDSYNFFPEDKDASCVACPENAKCDSVAIRPRDGYWHPSPCSDKLQECLTESACIASGRDQALRDLSLSLEGCVFNASFLESYSDAQCRAVAILTTGYKGPLCGYCAHGYGRARSFRCEKCSSNFTNYLLMLCAIVLLFALTGFTVRSSISVGHRLRESKPVNVFEPTAVTDPPGTLGDVEMTEITTTLETVSQRDTREQEACAKEVTDARQMELAQWKAAEILKITINFLQVLAVSVSLNVEWTDAMVSAFECAELLSGVTSEASVRSMDCLTSEERSEHRSFVRTLVSISVPVVVFLIYVLIWFVDMCRWLRSFQHFVKRCCLSLMVVSYVAYISITKTVVNVLNCIDVHDALDATSDSITRYWAVDTSLECNEGPHALVSALIGWPLLILFSFCFPVFTAGILIYHRSRKTNMKCRSLFEVAGFMYRSYRESYIFWESVIMLRKALLAIVVVFAYPLGGNLQGMLGVAILVLALYFHSLCRPYRTEFVELNRYEGLSLLISTLTFVSGLFFNDSRTSDGVRIFLTVAVLLGNFVLLAFFAVMFGFSCLVILKKTLAVQGTENSEELGVVSVLIVYARTKLGSLNESALHGASRETNKDTEVPNGTTEV